MVEQGAGAFKAAVVLRSSLPQDHHLRGLDLSGGGLGERKGYGVRVVTEDVRGAVHTAQVTRQPAGVNADGEGAKS